MPTMVHQPTASHSSSGCCVNGVGVVLTPCWQVDFVPSSFSTMFSQWILCHNDLYIAMLGLRSHHDQAEGTIQIHFIIPQRNQYLPLSGLSTKHCQISVSPDCGKCSALPGELFLLFVSIDSFTDTSFKPFISVYKQCGNFFCRVFLSIRNKNSRNVFYFQFFETLLTYEMLLLCNHPDLAVSGRERGSLNSF